MEPTESAKNLAASLHPATLQDIEQVLQTADPPPERLSRIGIATALQELGRRGMRLLAPFRPIVGDGKSYPKPRTRRTP